MSLACINWLAPNFGARNDLIPVFHQTHTLSEGRVVPDYFRDCSRQFCSFVWGEAYCTHGSITCGMVQMNNRGCLNKALIYWKVSGAPHNHLRVVVIQFALIQLVKSLSPPAFAPLPYSIVFSTAMSLCVLHVLFTNHCLIWYHQFSQK